MTTLTVREALERASTLVDDIDPQFVRWSQREQVAALNQGARALAKWLPPSVSRVDAIKLTAGNTRQSIADIDASRIIPGDGSAAARVQGVQLYKAVRNMGADGLTPGTAIDVVSGDDFTDRSWHMQTGAEIETVIYDARTPTFFYVSPAPSTPIWIELSYCALPRVISASGNYGMDGGDATLIPVADAYFDDLVSYMVAYMFLSKADLAEGAQMASAWTQMFVASVNAQATALTGNNPNLSMLPFAPAPAGRAG
ncbi:MAG: hypothetical protein IPO08_22895 [Xanthomonadales bacterium]|nr:hypothetical protein [Xanthomonadales bacterium]